LNDTLTDGGGGTWSSGAYPIATVGSTTGIVTGVSAGSVVIVYTLPTGCITNTTITVNASPSPISGTLNACTGGSSTLSDVTSFGVWTSSNPGIASIGSSSGTVTAGSSAGTSTISYTVSGCPALALFAVNASPGPITGTLVFCTGANDTLVDPGGIGNWSSSNTSIAIVGSTTGIVTGVSAGTSIISYSNGCGTPASTTVTVNQTPSAISGPNITCSSGSNTFTDFYTGGTWTSGSTGIASIGSSSGILTGVSQGTAIISYNLGDGCASATFTETVLTSPPAITGTTSFCFSSSTTLSNTSTGGTWTSSNIGVANVGSSSGLVSGVSAGTVTITYNNGCGTPATLTLTINGSPASIGGVPAVCVGTSSTLTDATPGGTWASSNTSYATVGSGTGIVTGVALGSATITYNTGCGTPATTTVNIITAIGTPTVTPTSATICNNGSIALSGGANINLIPVESV